MTRSPLRRPPDTRPGYATYPAMLAQIIRMHPDTITALRQAAPAQQAPPPWRPSPIAPLDGIPIVPDPDLPVGAWQLVDQDGRTIREHWPAPKTTVTRIYGRPWWRRRWQWSHQDGITVAYGWAWTRRGGHHRAESEAAR